MPIYKISSFVGGISDYTNKGIDGSFKFGKNINIRKEEDTLSVLQDLEDEGLVSDFSPSASASPSASPSSSQSRSQSASSSPTPSPSASASPSSSVSLSPSTTPSSSVSPSPSLSSELTSVFRDLIRSFVNATDGYTYGFGSTGYVYRRDSDAFWQVVYKDPDGAIKGAIEKPSDTGKAYLIFATDTKIKRKEIPGLSNWNDVETIGSSDSDTGAPLNSNEWHTMKQVEGAAMVANGPWLAMVGYDDSYTNEAVDLYPGNLAKTIVERNGRVIIGTARLSDPSKSINAAIDSEVPLAQVGDNGEIYFANMSDNQPVKRFPGGGKVNPGGVTNEVDQVGFFEWQSEALSWIDKQLVGNMSLWAVYDAESGKGGVYSYGRYNKNKPFVMNLDYQFDADELGAITSVDGTVIFSYQNGSEYGVKAVDSTTKATGVYESLELSAKPKKPGNITNWKYASVYLEPLPSGSSLQFKYKLNKTGDWVVATQDDGSESFTSSGETIAVFNIGSEGHIFEFQLTVTPSGNTSPEINMITVHFE